MHHLFCIACYCFSCNNLRCDLVHKLSSVGNLDCAFSASFVRECTDVSYVAGEGMDLTEHEERVDAEEIKAVELSSCAI